MNIPPFFRGPCDGKADTIGERGANRVAETIMRVWHKAGHRHVYAWPVRLDERETTGKLRYGVKTNLVRGLPPGRPW